MKKTKEEPEVVVSEEKDVAKLSKLLINSFNKDGKEKVAWNLATDLDNPTDVKEYISTGSTLLNYLIANKRNGGVPVGKLTEISGEEASGKSLLCAHLIAECQKRGGLAVYIDTENAASPAFMEQLGVNISQLVYLQPGTIEEVGELIEKTILMARAKAKNRLILIVWDSVAGTPCQTEIEGSYDPNDRIGVTAKAIAKMMRKLTQTWGKERIAMVFTNQLKVKIGVMYGDPMGTPGGKAIPYHASVRVRMIRGQVDADEKTKVVSGVHTSAKVVKNRLGPPLRKCEFDITFAYGIEDKESWFKYLHENGEIEKADGWCYYTSVLSGKKKTWRADGVDHKDADRGVQFREKDWLATLDGNQELLKKVEDDLEAHLVIRYGQRPKDQVIDPESLMDNEAVVDLVVNG